MFGRPLETICWVLVGMLLPATCLALGPDGSAIDTSDYTIDFYEGPVRQGARVMGLSGSIAPMAEGVAGYAVNPATAALRVPWSSRWTHWALGANIGGPSPLRQMDFDNNGTADTEHGAVFLMFGTGLQLGGFGIGLQVDSDRYQVESRHVDGLDGDLDVEQGEVNLVVGYGFWRGQLALGLGIGAYSVQLSPGQSNGNDLPLAAVSGGTAQLGGIWSPRGLPVRTAVSLRLPVEGGEGATPEHVEPNEEGDYVVEGYYFPRRITPPTELHVAVATQLFRPLNGPWITPPPRRRRRRGAPPPHESSASSESSASQRASDHRRHLLLSAALKTTLPVQNGVGIESFLTQSVEHSGRTTSFSPRVGVEGEPWTNMLVLRGGSYLEPSRFAEGAPRLHGTAGFDIHVPIKWSAFGLLDEETTFRIGGAVDGAARYFGWRVGVGLWHQPRLSPGG